MGNELMPVISSWANGWHGLDALTNPWNLVLGFAVFFLARLLGNLYFINNIRDKDLIPRCRRQLITDAIPFLILFLAFVIRTLLADGFAVNPETKEVYMEPYKYFINLMDIPLLLVLFLIRRGRGSLGHRKGCLQQDCDQWYLVYRNRSCIDCISFIALCGI